MRVRQVLERKRVVLIINILMVLLPYTIDHALTGTGGA